MGFAWRFCSFEIHCPCKTSNSNSAQYHPISIIIEEERVLGVKERFFVEFCKFVKDFFVLNIALKVLFNNEYDMFCEREVLDG